MMQRQYIEAILKILIIFLSALLAFSMLNGSVTLFMVIGALCTTYVIIHYWEKRFLRLQKQDKSVKVK